MAKYLIRSAQTLTLRARYDYEVEAASEEDAARLVADAQEEAQEDGSVKRVVGVRRILEYGPHGPTVTEDGVKHLSPENDNDSDETTETTTTLLSIDGQEIRLIEPTSSINYDVFVPAPDAATAGVAV